MAEVGFPWDGWSAAGSDVSRAPLNMPDFAQPTSRSHAIRAAGVSSCWRNGPARSWASPFAEPWGAVAWRRGWYQGELVPFHVHAARAERARTLGTHRGQSAVALQVGGRRRRRRRWWWWSAVAGLPNSSLGRPSPAPPRRAAEGTAGRREPRPVAATVQAGRRR